MTETTAAPDLAIVERYVEFWNAETAEEQRVLAARVFTEDVEYHAPVGIMRGVDALIDFRRQFVEHMGSAAVLARQQPERHHDRARLRWELEVGGKSFATGTDILEFEENDRISSISAFLDRAPEGFDPHAHE